MAAMRHARKRPGAVRPEWRAGVLIVMLVCSLPVLPVGCRPGAAAPEETVVQFGEAVQSQDLDRLFCLSAGAAAAVELGASEAERRQNFTAWALAQYDVYTEGRDLGTVELDGHGITLVKLFSLGRGTFARTQRVGAAGEAGVVIRSDLVFGYEQADLSRFSPGTTLYLCGAPVGRVQTVRVPQGHREITVEVLESISVEWTLVRATASGACPGGWAVASATPVEGSERTTELTWVF